MQTVAMFRTAMKVPALAAQTLQSQCSHCDRDVATRWHRRASEHDSCSWIGLLLTSLAHNTEQAQQQGEQCDIAVGLHAGVHWNFDCEEGAKLGEDIAARIAESFPNLAE